jgi:hypothetical protein
MTSGWIGAINDKMKYTAILCAAVPNVIGAAACAIYVYDVVNSMMNTAKTAANNNRGWTVEYAYNGMPLSWYVNW